jgi:hypothetical protein
VLWPLSQHPEVGGVLLGIAVVIIMPWLLLQYRLASLENQFACPK